MRRKLLFLPCLLSLVLAAACAAAGGEELSTGLPPALAARYRSEAMAMVSRLSLEEKCGEVLLIGVTGSENPEESSLETIRTLSPGGVVLFGFNLSGKAEGLGPYIAKLQDAAASSTSALPLIIAIDHEGGSVFRFRGGLTRLPAPEEVGNRGPSYANLLGRRAGLELAALGVNLALAPVVESLNETNRALLGNRAYGRDPELVDATAGAFMDGLQSSGIAATAKHFPGNAGIDPHRNLPVLEATRAELESSYFPRFAAAAKRGVGAVLLSHVLVPAIDGLRPATLSPDLVSGELKGRLGFDGVVITDDLFMKALSARYPPEKSAVLALGAGADLLMLTSGRSALRVRDAIRRAVESGRLPQSRLDDAVSRVLALKLRFSMAEGLDKRLRDERLEAFPDIVEESRKLIAEGSSRSSQVRKP